MSVNVRTLEEIRVQQQKEREIQLLVPQIGFVVIPYLLSGYIDYSNLGLVNERINPESVETFKRIFTGNDCINVKWKDSITLNQSEDNQSASFNYSIGDYFMGILENNNAIGEINKDISYSDYTNQQIKKTINLRVEASLFTISDYYQLMLFKIPELAGETLFKLSNIERVYEVKELMFYQLTFETINQELSQSGKARLQNINNSGAGEGYIQPKIYTQEQWDAIKDNEAFNFLTTKAKLLPNGNILSCDIQYLNAHPVKKIVFKAFGNSILSWVNCIGRPVGGADNPSTYRQPRLLFPMNLEQASTVTLHRTQNNSANMYFGEFSPTLDFYKDWLANLKDSMTISNKWNYYGFLRFNYDDLASTNPKTSGSYDYTIYGTTTNAGGSGGFRQWSFSNPHPGSINNEGNYGASANYALRSGSDLIHNHMWDNYWTQKKMTTLPLSESSTLTFTSLITAGLSLGASAGLYKSGGRSKALSILSLVAGAALLGVGIGATLANKMRFQQNPKFRGIINADFIELSKNQFGSDTTTNSTFPNKIPFNSLINDEESPNNAFFSANTLNTSFQATLTDSFMKSGVKYNTINIGQSKLEDNTPISGAPLLISGGETLTASDSVGFIIDEIQFQGVINDDVSIEFLDTNDNVIWSGIFQSQGKWSKSPREITNVFNVSTLGREDLYYNKPLPYPQQVPLDNMDLGLNKVIYDENSTFTPLWIDTLQEAFYYSTVNKPILSKDNVSCYSYLKQYRNMNSVSQAALFADSLFTTTDRVKQFVKAIRFYYVTENGGGGAIDYPMSQLGNEVAMINEQYDNATTETFPYQNATLTYNGVAGQNPSWNGANVWMTSYVRFGVPGLKWNVTIDLNTNNQTLMLSWNIQRARQDWLYNINGVLQANNEFSWDNQNAKIYPIAASQSYCYGTNQQALNNGASQNPPTKSDLLNMTYLNIGKQTSNHYDGEFVKNLWTQTNMSGNWANNQTIQQFSIVKIELIPYN